MGCGNSVQRQPDVSPKKDDRLPPIHKKPGVPKMVRADLEKPAEDKVGLVQAPTKLPALDAQLSKNARFELTTPDPDNAPTNRSAPSMPMVLATTSKGFSGQASLSNSTQQKYGLSDNTSHNSNGSLSDDEWYPREFGPVVESFCGTAARRSGELEGSLQNPYDDDDDRDGFYLHFLQVNGAGVKTTSRALSVKELIGQHTSENARTRYLMGGGGGNGTTSPKTGAAAEEKLVKSRYAAARDLGPVDADNYLDALYEHSRERERTHFFIDPDGEIRRLYHTEGWHLLGSTKRRKELQRHRSNSADSTGSRRGHRSRKSNGGGASSSSSGNNNTSARHPATANVAQSGGPTMPRNSADCGVHSPAEQLGGAASRLRNTRFGSSGMLNAHPSTAFTPVPPTQPKSGEGNSGRSYTHTSSSSSGGVSSPSHLQPQKTTSPPGTIASPGTAQRRSSQMGVAASGESAVSGSIGSGLAPTLPGSRSGGDFFSQAFGGGAGAEDSVAVTPTPSPSNPHPHISPILVKPDGDFPGSASRRASFNSSRREEESQGGDAAEASPRRRMSTRRVSFSQGTRYFKKDPFYIAPRSERDSEYADLTPPETELGTAAAPPMETAPPAAAIASLGGAPIALAPQRPDSSASYAQLTLLKDKMTQNRDRQLASAS